MEAEEYTILADIEKPTYIYFYTWAYKDDLELAQHVLEKSPRWSIIIGYYAMHDISKLYLGKVHNKKVSGENVHAKTIRVLKGCIEEEQTKNKIIGELEKAREKYELFAEGDEAVIIDILKQAKEERSKHQYYQDRFSDSVFSDKVKEEAKGFLDEIAKPFIQFMEGLMKENAGKHPRK